MQQDLGPRADWQLLSICRQLQSVCPQLLERSGLLEVTAAPNGCTLSLFKLCLAQVGNDIELDTVGRQFEPYLWRLCGVTWSAVPEQSW